MLNLIMLKLNESILLEGWCALPHTSPVAYCIATSSAEGYTTEVCMSINIYRHE